MIVTMKHAREVGYCARGMRVFAQRHGLDWTRFVRQGLDADELRKTDDAMAARVIEQAERDSNGRQ